MLPANFRPVLGNDQDRFIAHQFRMNEMRGIKEKLQVKVDLKFFIRMPDTG